MDDNSLQRPFDQIAEVQFAFPQRLLDPLAFRDIHVLADGVDILPRCVTHLRNFQIHPDPLPVLAQVAFLHLERVFAVPAKVLPENQVPFPVLGMGEIQKWLTDEFGFLVAEKLAERPIDPDILSVRRCQRGGNRRLLEHAAKARFALMQRRLGLVSLMQAYLIYSHLADHYPRDGEAEGEDPREGKLDKQERGTSALNGGRPILAVGFNDRLGQSPQWQDERRQAIFDGQGVPRLKSCQDVVRLR